MDRQTEIFHKNLLHIFVRNAKMQAQSYTTGKR